MRKKIKLFLISVVILTVLGGTYYWKSVHININTETGTEAGSSNTTNVMKESTTKKEVSTMNEHDSTSETKYELRKGFSYEAIPTSVQKKMLGKSYPKDCDFSLNNLRYVKVRYYDFNDKMQEGELVVAASIAQDILEIFAELYDAKYQIEKVRLVDEYDGNDDLSMADNNSSAFNYRVIDGTTTLSDHGLGLAIDINPLYNPYVRTGFGERDVLPVNGVEYADRNKDFPHKIVKGDICYNAFISHGFKWGGEWTDTIDYQHFYKN